MNLHAANRARLQEILNEILRGESQADFSKVADTDENRRRFCSYCVYRSRCDRGIGAGSLDAYDEAEFPDADLEDALDFTLEEIQELAF